MQSRLIRGGDLGNQLLSGSEELSKINDLAAGLLFSDDLVLGSHTIAANITDILLEDSRDLKIEFSNLEVAMTGATTR